MAKIKIKVNDIKPGFDLSASQVWDSEAVAAKPNFRATIEANAKANG